MVVGWVIWHIGLMVMQAAQNKEKKGSQKEVSKNTTKTVTEDSVNTGSSDSTDTETKDDHEQKKCKENTKYSYTRTNSIT